MKCLFCSSEALPFIASGGLAEVSGSLPKALNNLGNECKVVIPLYEDIPQDLKNSLKFVTSFFVPVSWRSQYCGVFSAKCDGVEYYLLDNEFYFKRHGLYGYYDDAERFAFFSRAILEMLPILGFKPDIIHANDWQTALVPVYYSLIYAKNEWFQNIKTIFTIHNIEYQGKYGYEINENVVGLPRENLSVLDFDGCINFMKGAIECANIVTTVSPTYANEILNPWFSHGLDPILRDRSFKVKGILNGIDTKSYDPERDKDIYYNYSYKNVGEKLKNKVKLQERLNLTVDKKIPMIAMVTRLAEHKGIDLVLEVLERFLNNNQVQFVVLGCGEKKYENFFDYLQFKFPDKVCACKGFVPELSRKIYASSDMFLMPSKSEPCGLAQMIALRYGSIPIVRETGGLFDTVKDSGDGKGNGFTFKNYNAYDMLGALQRAIKGYENTSGWGVLTKRVMMIDNGWDTRAAQYSQIFK